MIIMILLTAFLTLMKNYFLSKKGKDVMFLDLADWTLGEFVRTSTAAILQAEKFSDCDEQFALILQYVSYSKTSPPN